LAFENSSIIAFRQEKKEATKKVPYDALLFAVTRGQTACDAITGTLCVSLCGKTSGDIYYRPWRFHYAPESFKQNLASPFFLAKRFLFDFSFIPAAETFPNHVK
jgi:hypothetical protein